MKSLALHIECLRELEALERGRRRLTRPAALGFVAGGVLLALGIAGCRLLEELALERIGLR